MESRPALRPFLSGLALSVTLLATAVAPAAAGDGESVVIGPIPVEGPTCSADAEPSTGASLQALQDQLRSQLRPGDDGGVVLNGRGYNYRVDQDLDAVMARLRAEARAARSGPAR
ncbi:MAG: hypothetical protein QNK04_24890 [Myxococcota bacterium]|nr:hypothetical protein [Myxococcota bacterium]